MAEKGGLVAVHKSFKFSNFLDTIDKYAKRRKSKIADEIKEIEEKELKKAEAEIIEDVNNMVQRKLVEMKNKIVVEISHKELSHRKEISLRRKEIMKEIFKECRQRLLDFTLSEKYPEALKEYALQISRVLVESDTKLFVKEEDLKYSDLIKEAFGRECSINASDDIMIGGIRGYSASRGLIADETLDAKLKDQEDWAAKNFGVLLA